MKKSTKKWAWIAGAGAVGVLALIALRRKLGETPALIDEATKQGLESGLYRYADAPGVVSKGINVGALGLDIPPEETAPFGGQTQPSGDTDPDVTATPLRSTPDVSRWFSSVEGSRPSRAEQASSLERNPAHSSAPGAQATIQRGVTKWGRLSDADRYRAVKDFYALYQVDHSQGTAQSYRGGLWDWDIESSPYRFSGYRVFTTQSGDPYPFWSYVAGWTPPQAGEAAPSASSTQTDKFTDRTKTGYYQFDTQPQEAELNLSMFGSLRPGILLRRG